MDIDIGVTVNFDGKPTRQHGIGWSDTPLAIAFLKPYLITPLNNNFLEIRILTSQNTGKKETFVQVSDHFTNN